MVREETIQTGKEGMDHKILKRELLGVRMLVDAKKAVKTDEIPVYGRRVIGGYFMYRVKQDAPIVVYTRYYGVGPADQDDEAFIKSLNSETMTSRIGRVTVNAGAGEKIYIAQPTIAGTPRLLYNGFEGGFLTPKVVTVADPTTGAEVDYLLYESVSENLEETTIEIA